jgi:RNA polymerase sigma factor (sigma-70 family)
MTGSNESNNNPHSNWQDILIYAGAIEKFIVCCIRQLKLKNFYDVEEIENEIFLLIHKLIDSERLRDEIIEDCLVFIIIRSNGTREPIRNLEAWLRTVIWNYLRGRRRRENRENRVILFDEYPDRRMSPSDYVQNTELRQKLTLLSNEDRRILELFFFEDLSFREIAIRLQEEGFGQYTEAALRQKKFRALDKLRKIY